MKYDRRAPKANERVKALSGGRFEYYDELNRNTYYWAPYSTWNRGFPKWAEKEWVRLPNGEDRETYILNSDGYWRRHWYDIHTGELLKEIDSTGETNLLSKRQAWNKRDEQLSLEYKQRGKVIPGASHKLF